MHHQRQGQPEHEFDEHRNHRDHKCDDKGTPPISVAQDGDVIVEPHESAILRTGEAVLLHAQPDGVADGICGDRQHQQRCRRDEQQPEPPFGPLALGACPVGHGISPRPSTAFCTWSFSRSAVRSGSIPVIGANTAETRVEMA
ncbi:Uncharacterised protein [Mycobacteroides abscessus subsp. massiliense]|nr:Uncharacterised protein [Mycobacteroides abscessus subsp. massiliense]